jgi:hypothetical protein
VTSTVESVTIPELKARGIVLTTSEAVAIVQSLIANGTDDEARAPFGPLQPDNIVIHHDGSVTSSACAVTPTVLEAAIVLHGLLPFDQPNLPGALRYTLGRALHEVAGPPFDSLNEFSQALARFEAGDRAETVRILFARATAPRTVISGPWSTVGLPFAAALLAGCALIGAGEAMHAARSRTDLGNVPPRSTALTARPIAFNPPLTVAAFPEPRAWSSVTATAPRANVGRSLDRRPSRPAQAGSSRQRRWFPSRILPRIRIEFEEL